MDPPIPSGSTVFIDANIFIYHFSGPTALTPSCTALLERVVGGEVTGVTSTTVVLETLHRLMLLEAIAKFQLTPKTSLRFLKANPDQVKTLSECHRAVETIAQIGIQIVGVTPDDISHGQQFQRQHGVLTNDALILAVMVRQQITALVSNDPDFQKIPQLRLHRPVPA